MAAGIDDGNFFDLLPVKILRYREARARRKDLLETKGQNRKAADDFNCSPSFPRLHTFLEKRFLGTGHFDDPALAGEEKSIF